MSDTVVNSGDSRLLLHLGSRGITHGNVFRRQGVRVLHRIAEHLGVSNAAASQMVDRLVGMGLLERSEDPDDRRAKALALTEKGKALVLDSIEAKAAGIPVIIHSIHGYG